MKYFYTLLLFILLGCKTTQITTPSPVEKTYTIHDKILNSTQGLELKANRDIEKYYWYFLNEQPETIKKWLENSKDIIPYVKNEFVKEGLPVDLIYLPFLESGYNPMAYSWVGAGGVWQFMPKTGKSYGLNINWWIDERRSYQKATPQAINHLKHLYRRFDDWYLALAAYNAGEGRVSTAIKNSGYNDYFTLTREKQLPKETRNYVTQFIAIVKIMKNLEALGFKDINWEIDNDLYAIDVPGGTDLYKLALECGLTYDKFKTFNPSFRRKVTDPSKKLTIYIPEVSYQSVKTYLKKSSPITIKGWEYYTVRKGDSWTTISILADAPVDSLKRLNDTNSNKLKVGQRVLVPKLKVMPKVLIASANSNTQYNFHRVKKGDTLSGISIMYNIKLKTIYYLNGLNPYSILKVGQSIKLPKVNNRIHLVVKGETLWGISKNYNISVDRIMKINNINNPRSLKIGERLILY